MIYTIPPYDSFGKYFCSYWEDFLSDDEINLILSQPEWLQLQPGVIGGGTGPSEVNETIRRSQISWLGMKPEISHIWKKLSTTVAEINSRFFHFDLTGFYEQMQLSVYTDKDIGHYDWHQDMILEGTTGIPRKLSMSMLLSDPSDFEGGELQVLMNNNQPRALEQKRGRAWFFPSWTLHRVTPVTRGVRRSVVLWIGGPGFK